MKNLQENNYAEQVILAFQNRLGVPTEEARQKIMTESQRKAEVVRKGKTVKIIAKSNTIYTPDLWIQDMDSFEETLEEYLRSNSRKSNSFNPN